MPESTYVEPPEIRRRVAIDALPRFMAKVRVAKRTGCWEWTGHIGAEGYGFFRAENRRPTYAHRFAQEMFNGPIPDGWTTDHLCRNRICCNPDHLEAVPHVVNVRRSPLTTARSRYCQRGHDLDEHAEQKSNGRRQCAECRRERMRRYYQDLKAS